VSTYSGSQNYFKIRLKGHILNNVKSIIEVRNVIAFQLFSALDKLGGTLESTIDVTQNFSRKNLKGKSL